jgi:uncharacterized protein YndB with AHSA1/START domain
MKEFAQWFRVNSSDEFRPNTRVSMRSTYPGYEDKDFWMDVVDIKPESHFSWRWHPGDPKDGPIQPDDQPTLVTFVLEDVEGGTRVTVTETGFNYVSAVRRAKAIQANTQGWKVQMENLRTYVEQAA